MTGDGFRELLECGNGPIADAALKCQSVFNSHKTALVSISGGADSDVMIDICERVREIEPIKIFYAFCDTGMELDVTKEWLDHLEDRYGVKILRQRAEKTIPVSVKEDGQPFLSKAVSKFMGRLQTKGFQWEPDPYETLVERYPMSSGYLKWWTSERSDTEPNMSPYRISRNKWLREFIIDNPPWFAISDKCCYYAKKHPAHVAARKCHADVVVQGIRKAEGGVRAFVDKCFTSARPGEIDVYRPLFWLKDADKALYESDFGITHNKCYTEWGFKRTGCTGCPFNRDYEKHISIIGQHEPRMERAARKIFADSYEYTQMYRDYVRRKNDDEADRLTVERALGMGYSIREI